MCQQCVENGRLKQATYDAMEAFCEVWPRAECGPAHIVLGDQNVADEHLTWCIALCTAALSQNPADLESPADIDLMEHVDWYQDHDSSELEATQVFLRALLAIPEAQR